MRTSKLFLILLMVIVLVSPTCATPTSVRAEGDTPYWPEKEWRTSTPEEQGMDSDILLKGLPSVSDLLLDGHSLVVIRHGYMVLEASAYPFSASKPQAFRDAAEPVMATLIGIAIDKGYIKSVDQSIWDFLPKENIALMNSNKAALTIRHLLNGQTGLAYAWGDDAKKYYALTEKDEDWVRVFLSAPASEKPGMRTKWLYGDALVLSAILQKATGSTALEFAKQYLFGPLGITDVAWSATPQGVNIGADELFLSPCDMAKLSYLYLRNGQWNDQQIVSAEWVKTAISRQVATPFEDWAVGYSWFVGQFAPTSYTGYWQSGAGGQWIWGFPELDLIAVATGYGAAQPVLNDFLLPAVKSSTALPANAEAMARLTAKVQALANPAPSAVEPIPAEAKAAAGRLYTLEDNALGWKSISIDFGAEEATLTLNVADRTLTLPVGMDNIYRISADGLPANPGLFRFSEIAPLALKGRWAKGFTIIMADLRGKDTWIINLAFETSNDIRVEVRLSGLALSSGGVVGNQQLKIKGVAQ